MQEKLENGIMGPQKILFTTDDEFIKQKAEQLNKSSTNSFRTSRERGLISISTISGNNCVLAKNIFILKLRNQWAICWLEK